MPVRLVLWAAVLGAVVLGLGRDAQAQVRFSIGGDGWSAGNGYYPYGSGYGWGPRYYSPPIVIQPQYNQPQVQYVPVPAANPQPYDGPGLLIRNPAKSTTTLSYTIDERQSYDIEPGEVQHLTTKPKYLVEFDRGGDFGQARYTIHEGLYEFALTDHGWELYRQRSSNPDAAAKVKANPLPGKESKDEKAAEQPIQPPPPVEPKDT